MPASAWVYNYFRDYDPATGRYAQSDPIGLRGGINTYSYARSSPMRHSDPTGLAPPRSQPGTGFPPLFPPGPFDDSWNRSRDDTALWLEDQLVAAAEIIDFQKKKREREKAKAEASANSCPPPEDNGCHRKQQTLLVQRELLSKNLYKVQLWEYRTAVLLFNSSARIHNVECPDFKVAELIEPGPEMPPGAY